MPEEVGEGFPEEAADLTVTGQTELSFRRMMTSSGRGRIHAEVSSVGPEAGGVNGKQTARDGK